VSKAKRRPTGSTIGAILVGFDQDVFRTLPPAEELVAKSKPVRGVPGRAPGLEITFPDDIDVEPRGVGADGGVEPGRNVVVGRDVGET
jgi:hypothetical protein